MKKYTVEFCYSVGGTIEVYGGSQRDAADQVRKMTTDDIRFALENKGDIEINYVTKGE